MHVVYDYPPNYSDLVKVFPITRTVIFAWGDIIYNPGKVEITPELVEHEKIHGARQKPDIIGWWNQYIESPAFRLQEEIPAHQAEFMWLMRNGNRKIKRLALKMVANKLSAPLYGQLLSPKEARKIIESSLKGE